MGKAHENSGSGPDWIDIAGYVQEVEKTHQCTITLAVSRLGSRRVPTLLVDALATWPDLGSEGSVAGVGAGGRFPCGAHATFEGLIYDLLVRLDWQLSKERWYQPKLPLEDPPGVGG